MVALTATQTKPLAGRRTAAPGAPRTLTWSASSCPPPFKGSYRVPLKGFGVMSGKFRVAVQELVNEVTITQKPCYLVCLDLQSAQNNGPKSQEWREKGSAGPIDLGILEVQVYPYDGNLN